MGGGAPYGGGYGIMFGGGMLPIGGIIGGRGGKDILFRLSTYVLIKQYYFFVYY